MFKTTKLTRKEAAEIFNAMTLIIQGEKEPSSQGEERVSLPKYHGYRIRRQQEELKPVYQEYFKRVQDITEEAIQIESEALEASKEDKSVDVTVGVQFKNEKIKELNEEEVEIKVLKAPLVLNEDGGDFGDVDVPSRVWEILPDFMLKVK